MKKVKDIPAIDCHNRNGLFFIGCLYSRLYFTEHQIACYASALSSFSCYFAIQTKFVKLIHSKLREHKTKIFINSYFVE